MYDLLTEQLIRSQIEEEGLDLDVFEDPGLIEQLLDHYDDNIGVFNEIPPLSCLPKISFEKKSKMEWCMKDAPSPDMVNSFRTIFQRFLGKYAPEELFTPPASSTMKTGHDRFNDGGIVKYDSERADHPDCGFLYQKFVTQPLQMREVWLPSKVLKTNSTAWFEITRPIINRVPYALIGNTTSEIADILKERRTVDAKAFDFYAYGLQYPREYLSVMGEEIAMLYPSVELTELVVIMNELFAHTRITMPDGEVKHPPRGIGLGYYETLKTLGTMAILDKYNPIAVWGDEGLLPKKTFKPAMGELKALGFYENLEKREVWPVDKGIYWAGFFLDKEGLSSTPGEYWTSLHGGWTQRTHWERKVAISNSPLYSTMARVYAAYVQERMYGFEFFRGESFKHPLNGGMIKEATISMGHDRSANLLGIPMNPKSKENYLWNYPSSIPEEGHQLKIAKTRRIRWKDPILYRLEDYLFIHPKCTIQDVELPSMSDYARKILPRVEERLLIYNRMYTEKLTLGYSINDLYDVYTKFSIYADPLRSSRGTARVLHTPTRDPYLSSEREFLVDYLQGCERIEDRATPRVDIETPLERFERLQKEYYRYRQLDDSIDYEAWGLPRESKDVVGDHLFGDLVRSSLSSARKHDGDGLESQTKRIRLEVPDVSYTALVEEEEILEQEDSTFEFDFHFDAGAEIIFHSPETEEVNTIRHVLHEGEDFF